MTQAEDEERADLFNDFYCNTFHTLVLHLRTLLFSPFLLSLSKIYQLESDEVHALLMSLSQYRSSGPDNISTRFVQRGFYYFDSNRSYL